MATPQVINANLAASVLPRRNAEAHKWGVGGLFVIAGAPQYLGAVAMSARSAGRCGAGIVTLAVPRQMIAPIQTIVPEATFIALADTDSAGGAHKAIDDMRERADKSKAYLIGPGLGDDSSVDHLLAAVFGMAGRSTADVSASLGFAVRSSSGRTDKSNDAQVSGLPDRPTVLDADGLNWLSRQDDWPKLLAGRTLVLTPHPGEAGRLLGRDPAELLDDPVATANELAARSGQTVVFKAGRAIVSDGTTIRIAAGATPALATAGSGDVLSGAIAAFLAQGLSPMDAASLAIYLGGVAAQQLTTTYGTLGVVASDLPDALARATAEIEKGS